MILKIYTLRGIKFEGDAISLNVKTAVGEITILDNHRPLVTVLERGTAVVKMNGGQEKIKIESGFLEMGDRNNLTVLLD